ncbi:SixA phosphatase family protein [Mariniluteicoccus flavus]
MARLLILMRHAQAVDFAPGRPDSERALTDRGHDQAREVAAFLASKDIHVDHALVSAALRTRQTAADLGLDCPVEHLDRLYNASESTILEAVAEAPADADTLLVIAHNPGIHAATLELADVAGHPDGARLAHSFPSATAVGLTVPGGFADVTPGVAVAFVHFARAGA